MVSDISCWVMAGIFVMGLIVLAVRLKEVQITDVADYNYANTRQSVRRVQTDGIRGRILDRQGRPMAENRRSLSIVCNASFFQKRTWDDTVMEIEKAITNVALIVGRHSLLTTKAIRRHINQTLAMPLVAWRDISWDELAKFSEHEFACPGFECHETEERTYPQGRVASHLIGYVGRDRAEVVAGDEKFNFYQPEMRGRSGLELFYDSYVRGVSGEEKLLVDARGFAIRKWTVVESQKGPDLRVTIDLDVQRAVEAELRGEKGACVVMDPRNGDVLAMASAPDFDPNAFVPNLSQELYASYANNPDKPLLNRAAGGAYAPGSTFKPITALAGLSAGYSDGHEHDCVGVFVYGTMRLHCARRWGHGPLAMREALKESCNSYFCNLGAAIGTNAIIRAAKELGLGSKTGIDFGVDMAGTVPDAEWKQRVYKERWFPGDLPQMSIGQGMLLVSPLQMARVVGAIGTGYLVVPHLKQDILVERQTLPFAVRHLKVVRDGMRMVVNGGTGKMGGINVDAYIIGKTGTAEIGIGERKRKNTWFIAYASGIAITDKHKQGAKPSTEVAVAMIIENGQSGGGTTAPKVRNVLASIFGEIDQTEGVGQ